MLDFATSTWYNLTMNSVALNFIITSIIGATVVVSGVSMPIRGILDNATRAANMMSNHQLALALEFYYDDHQRYPPVQGGENLIEELFQGGYIRNRPLDSSLFQYESKEGGQDYQLSL